MRFNCFSFDHDYRSLYTPLLHPLIIAFLMSLPIQLILRQYRCDAPQLCHKGMCHYLLLTSDQNEKRTPQFYKKSMDRAPMMSAPKEEATTVLPAPVNAAGVLVALEAPVAWT